MDGPLAGLAPAPAPAPSETRDRQLLLTLGALGVVFGDIGTSPLYALKECFAEAHGFRAAPENVLGVLSLIFWAIMLVVSLKYVSLVMRADNKGEGGILALLSLVSRHLGTRPWLRAVVAVLGIFGASLFFGDAVITPAISVLSAVEGLEVLQPKLAEFVVPVTLVVLVALFAIQRHGTARVGGLFGPVTLIWFLTLGILGLVSIVQTPAVLAAMDPRHGLSFFQRLPLPAFLTLGSVVLAVTGTEALYADMGHFGRAPIQRGWFGVVWPGLVLNYFGQGALLLRAPEAVSNPFYLLAPQWFLPVLLVLATLATVIASQAVISGAFSITRQAMQLGYVPRLRVMHTSDRDIGQIYLPFVNWILLAGVLMLVLSFRSSNGLAAAYGIAVTGAMLVDTLLLGMIMVFGWRWNKFGAIALVLMLLCIDMGFLSANALKVISGGWLPLTIAILVFITLTSWRRGRSIVADSLRRDAIPQDAFLSGQADFLPRVEGTAVFMSSNPHAIPHALLHNLKHNKVVHERVVFLTVLTEDEPHVSEERRVEIQELGRGFFRMLIRYGFSDEPDIPLALEGCANRGMAFDMMDTSFFLGRETVIPVVGIGMAFWREQIFAWMMRNAAPPTEFFRIPPNRVVELGTQLEI